MGSMLSTVGSATFPARDRDDTDNADNGGPHYDALTTNDAAQARRVARRLGVAVLYRWKEAAATAAGRGRSRGLGEGPAVPGTDGTAAAAGRERFCRLEEKPTAEVAQ